MDVSPSKQRYSLRLKPKEKERKKRSELNGTNRFFGLEIDWNVRNQGKIRSKISMAQDKTKKG